MYSAFNHWAYWSHMLPVLSMCSQCAQWVFGPLSPVYAAAGGEDEKEWSKKLVEEKGREIKQESETWSREETDNTGSAHNEEEIEDREIEGTNVEGGETEGTNIEDKKIGSEDGEMDNEVTESNEDEGDSRNDEG